MRERDLASMNLASVIQNIEIQRARRIGNGTLAPQGRFNFMQKCHESNGLKSGADCRNRIDEGWIAGIGPCLGLIKGRDCRDFHSGAVQSRQRGLQGLGGRSCPRRNIGA